MSKIYLGQTVNPGIGISLPATIEEMREAYSPLNGTGTVPLETVTTHVRLSIPNLHQYLYGVPVSEKRLEEPNYLAHRMKWMGSQDEAVFRTVIKVMKPETFQDMINLSCNVDRFRYLPSITTEVKLEEYLLKGNADMATEEQAARSNYEGIGKDYIRKHGDMFHAFGYTSGIQEELEPICRGEELPDPDFKQTCSFKAWTYKGNPYDNYTLSPPAIESKMDAFKSAIGVLSQGECKQLTIQCRVPALWGGLPECDSIGELNDLVTEHCQSMENQRTSVLEIQVKRS